MAATPFLIDTSHNNLVIPKNNTFKGFFHSLLNQGYHFEETDPSVTLEEELFEHTRLFLIGVPQTSFYTQDEINIILDYVRRGGSILIFTRYGGDILQKSNLNELTSHFGIFSESTLVCSAHNMGLESIPIITSYAESNIMGNLKKIVFPGSCSLRTSKDAQMLCQSDFDGWIQLYNPHSFDWIKDESSPFNTVAAYSVYGQGHVITIGTPDFLNNNEFFGLSCLDNHRFLHNILKWLTLPASENEVKDWILQQLGSFSEEIIKMNTVMGRLSDTMSSFDRRIRDLEMMVYELKGVHLPKKEE